MRRKWDAVEATSGAEGIKAAFVATEGDVEQFMEGVYDLGLAAHAEPTLLNSPEVDNFLQRSAEDLRSFDGDIHRFIKNLSSWLHRQEWGSVYFDPSYVWLCACRERSSIEFLFELYRGTAFEEYFHFLLEDSGFVEGIDEEILRPKAAEDGIIKDEDRPAAMPRSHWWWWPDEIESPA
ncbi:MAG TPA: hypothetical protein VM870_07850 [Pyrinomonadaceae bacterium]|nr:hypothetical protein [Pyrinomonadaceae bacterium]